VYEKRAARHLFFDLDKDGMGIWSLSPSVLIVVHSYSKEKKSCCYGWKISRVGNSRAGKGNFRKRSW
jgi:hypothetical protein